MCMRILFCIHKNLVDRVTQSAITDMSQTDPRMHTLVERVTQSAITDMSQTDPRMHTGSPRMRMGSMAEKFAYGETHYA